MATPRRPFNPNLLLLDDGREFDTTNLSGLDAKFIGKEQHRLRQSSEIEKGYERRMMGMLQGGTFSNFLKSPYDNLGVGDVANPWAAYSGLLQGKENAAKQAGMNFSFDPKHQFGTLKTEALYKPTWDPDAGQSSALSGLYVDDKGNRHFRRNSDPVIAGLKRIR